LCFGQNRAKNAQAYAVPSKTVTPLLKMGLSESNKALITKRMFAFDVVGLESVNRGEIIRLTLFSVI
jgi:hypothetical protein